MGGSAGTRTCSTRNTSGSSSGSGAAVAASYAAAAIGTETDGSIVSPANNTCLVGIKPTLGLVSRHGIIPIAHTQDTAGPMARTVADAAAVLTAIVGFDPADPDTKPAATRMARDYTQALASGGLNGLRIGVPRKHLFGGSPHADRLVEAALAVMKSLGAEIIDPVELAMPDDLGKVEYEVLLYEFKADLNRYLASLGPGARVKSLKEAIAFNEANTDREMPYFGQEIFLEAEAKGPLTSPDYLKALGRNKQATRERGIDAVMDEAPARRARGSDERPALADGSRQRRLRAERRVEHPGDCRIPAHHGARRLRLGPARRHVDLRPRVERDDAHPDRLRVRAGDEAPEGAAVPGTCGGPIVCGMQG